jgi:hypothetical protein
MRNPFLFFRDLVKQPLGVSAWVVILALANLASLLFWAAPLAKIIFLTFIMSAVAKLILFSCFGFEKILGIAHVFWIYLIPFIVLQLAYVEGIFFVYLAVLALLLTIALVVDAIDVWRYFRDLRM